MELCDKSECTGCMACFNVCPNNSIDIKEDYLGFKYPTILDSCINCGLCNRVCPNLNYITFVKPRKCYAVYSKEKYENATSGGIASLLYNFYLNLGNTAVYGVLFDKEISSFIFKKCIDIKDIEMLSGSKYTQADINDIFKSCKEDLENNIDVLFIGTPCQISGLKFFLRKEYSNLTTIDFVCHGVPSQKMLYDSLINNIIGKIEKISFRKSNKYCFNIMDENSNNYIINSFDSKYFEGFSNGTIIRSSCHECIYAQHDRISDITLGDFWGLDKSSKLFEKQNKNGGVSLLLINTKRGLDLFSKIESLIIYDEREIEEAYDGNSQLNMPVPESKSSENFRKYYETYSFDKSIEKSRTFKSRLRHNSIFDFIYRRLRNGR